MDYVLHYADAYALDGVYARAAALAPSIAPQLLARDSALRQTLSLFVLNAVGGAALYVVLATASFYLLYDHAQMRHPKFLKNQIRRELALSFKAMPVMALLTAPIFLAEVRGQSKLYDRVDDHPWGWGLVALSVPLYLLFTDMCIYWIHRWEHHPRVYAYVHKPHHAWKVPTPFAAYAFHPLDGWLQALPYHLYPFLFPLHKTLYLALFVVVMMWTVFIHDGAYFIHHDWINGAAHHTVHHLEFNYNYGQYFTLWDRIGGSHKQPTPENTMPQRNPKFNAKPVSAAAPHEEKIKTVKVAAKDL